MKRLLYLAALSMVATLLFAPTALAQVSPSEQGTCPEGFILYEGPGTATGQCVPSDRGVNVCSDFASQFAAQQYYDNNAAPAEQTILDPNGDGLACTGGDVFTAADDQYTPAADQYTPAADQYAAPADDTAVLPASGGPALLLPAGMLLLGAGLLRMGLVRRS